MYGDALQLTNENNLTCISRYHDLGTCLINYPLKFACQISLLFFLLYVIYVEIKKSLLGAINVQILIVQTSPFDVVNNHHSINQKRLAIHFVIQLIYDLLTNSYLNLLQEQIKTNMVKLYSPIIQVTSPFPLRVFLQFSLFTILPFLFLLQRERKQFKNTKRRSEGA